MEKEQFDVIFEEFFGSRVNFLTEIFRTLTKNKPIPIDESLMFDHGWKTLSKIFFAVIIASRDDRKAIDWVEKAAKAMGEWEHARNRQDFFLGLILGSLMAVNYILQHSDPKYPHNADLIARITPGSTLWDSLCFELFRLGWEPEYESVLSTEIKAFVKRQTIFDERELIDLFRKHDSTFGNMLLNQICYAIFTSKNGASARADLLAKACV